MVAALEKLKSVSMDEAGSDNGLIRSMYTIRIQINGCRSGQKALHRRT